MERGSKEWKLAEKRLKEEAIILRKRSRTLREQSVELCNEINAFTDKYPDATLNDLPWDEKERVMDKAEELRQAWAKNRKWLITLDAEFRELCRRTNEFYGEELFKPTDIVIPEAVMEEEKEEPSEEWGKSEDWWRKE